MAHHAVRHATEQSSVSVEPEEVRQTLEKILTSKHFVNAPKKKGFLSLICSFYLDGRAHELNEYILGYDVFGRDAKYDPSDDPVVRVTAHEIRKKLELYYQGEGINDAIRLEVPAGSYQPVFTKRATATPNSVGEALPTPAPIADVTLAATESTASRGNLPLGILSLSITVLLLVGVAIVQWVSNRELQRMVLQADSATTLRPNLQEYGPVWGTFLSDPNPPLAVLSTPKVYRFVNASDPSALTDNAIQLTPEQVGANEDRPESSSQFIRRGGDRLIPSVGTYTGMGEAVSLHRLTELFSTANKNIQFKQSHQVSAADMKYRNVILLGSVFVNEWSGKLPAGETFLITDGATIENKNPQLGEEREYKPQFDEQTGQLLIDYALITVKPNVSTENTVMTLAGIYSEGTEAAGEFVTNRTHLAELTQRLRQTMENNDVPKYYQALLKVGVENGTPTTISILAIHESRVSER